MESLLNRELPKYGLSYEKLDVDDPNSDPELAKRYGTVVPVLLRNGRAVAKVRLDEKGLRRIVRRRR